MFGQSIRLMDSVVGRTPAGWGNHEDIQRATGFLASGASDFLKCPFVDVDGGIVASVGSPSYESRLRALQQHIRLSQADQPIKHTNNYVKMRTKPPKAKHHVANPLHGGDLIIAVV